MGKLIGLLKWIGVGLVIWFGGSILIFILNFSNQDISDNIEKWGQMGDFFGGILNPCLALANLAVLFYITKEVSRLETERHEKQLSIERERYSEQNKLETERYNNQIKIDERKHLNDFRYKAYNDFIEKFDSLNNKDFLEGRAEHGYDISIFINYKIEQMNKFHTNNYFMFRERSADYLDIKIKIVESLKKIKNEIDRISEDLDLRGYDPLDEDDYGNRINHYNTKEVRSSVKDFISQKNEMKAFIQKVMIGVDTSLKQQ